MNHGLSFSRHELASLAAMRDRRQTRHGSSYVRWSIGSFSKTPSPKQRCVPMFGSRVAGSNRRLSPRGCFH